MEINRLTITTESRILGDEYVRFGGEYIETCFHKGKKGALCLAIGGMKEDGRRGDNAPQSKLVTEKRAVARFKLHMDERKMDNRKCLSEHPFGTIKRTIGEGFFLLRRMFKTEGEMALYCLAYNMRRAMNMRTMGELVAGMAE